MAQAIHAYEIMGAILNSNHHTWQSAVQLSNMFFDRDIPLVRTFPKRVTVLFLRILQLADSPSAEYDNRTNWKPSTQK